MGMGIAGQDISKDVAFSSSVDSSDLESRLRRRRRQAEARHARMENEEEVVIGDMLRTAFGILGCLFLSFLFWVASFCLSYFRLPLFVFPILGCLFLSFHLFPLSPFVTWLYTHTRLSVCCLSLSICVP